MTTRFDQQLDEPVAVVGLGCRFPGGGHGPERFWTMLEQGRDAVGPFPEDRIGALFHDPDPERRGRTHATAGCFLDGVEEFDAEFFGIAPREARFVDPMFRLLLETSWEAFEDAGQPPHQLAGSRTGVFVGVYATDFMNLQAWQGSVERTDAYASGALHCMASGRLAHAFDLQGPALSVDTACSSSLVSLHLAAESLRRGECDLALSAGVSLMLSPDFWISLSLANMISADGRCKTFDAAADGYGRGEGCGVLVLKRLRDAEDGQDRILAVLRGSAVKHDGRSASITAPNGVAQRAVIREAIARAGLTPGDIGYVEAHGTGTPLGDPIELSALGEVLGPAAGAPEVLVGSVKTNIGHLEGAAGVAGVIKTILSFEHGVIPAHLNLHELNPRIELAGTRIRIPSAASPWPVGRRIAGVNSFGLSGTNAHVLLEAPPRSSGAVRPAQPRPVVLTLSARSEAALSTMASNLLESLQDSDITLADAAFTANTGRTPLPHRAAIVAEDRPTALAQLAVLSSPGVTRAVAPSRPARVAFLYSGQGAQHVGMGRQLYRDEAVFRDALDECAAALAGHLDRPLLEVMFGEDAVHLLDRTEYTQPTLFAFEYALTALWQSMGVRPDAVLGHSVGAYAAACAAGVFDLPAAAELIAVRGRLMRTHTEPGAMYSVLAPAEVVLAVLGDCLPQVALAAVNGPQAVTVSGAEAAVAEAVRRLADKGFPCRRLPVSHAFHSPLMDPMLDEFERAVAKVGVRTPDIAFVSDSTGEFADTAELAAPGYWRQHARQPVRFADGVRTLAEAGCTVLVEIGPGAVLAKLARRCVDTGTVRVLAALDGTQDEPTRVQRTLAELFTRGAPIDFTAYHQERPGRLRRLPTYPFERVLLRNELVERAKVSLNAQACGESELAGAGPAVPYAGRPTWLADAGVVCERRLSEHEPHVAADHRLFGRIVVPGAYWLAAAAAAAWATEPAGHDDVELAELVFSQPLVLAGEHTAVVQCQLTPDPDPRCWRLRVHSAVDGPGPLGPWSDHATGTVRLVPADTSLSANGIVEPLGQLAGADFYRQVGARGLELGPTFRWLHSAQRGSGRALVELGRPGAVGAAAVAPPGLLDACFQAIAGALPDELMQELAQRGTLLVPFTIDRLTVARRPVDRAWCSVSLREIAQTRRRQVVADVMVRDAEGRQVVRLDGVRLIAIEPEVVGAGSAATARQYRICWRPVQLEPATPGRGRWLIWSDDLGFGRQVADLLDSRGVQSVLVSTAPSSAAQWRELLSGVGGVLHLRGLGRHADPVGAQHSLTGGLLELLQGCATAEVGGVWVATRGAVRVRDEQPDVAQAPLHGLVRTFAAENPKLLGGLVDLDPAGDLSKEDARRLVELMLRGDREPQLALRAGTWHAPRLTLIESVEDLSRAPAAPRADGSYLVTGGLGAVGLAVARQLLADGAGCVVLNGRAELRDRGRAAMADLGGPAHYFAGDMSDLAQADAVVARIARELPPLRGVVHAAGVLDDATLPQQSWARVSAVLAPKVSGAWQLHLATRGQPLDFFVLCSSIAGMLGTPGQAGYAAANTFLDALAGYRRAAGLPALSVAWGPWAGDGMVAEAGAADRLTASGLRPMPPAAALAELARALSGDHEFVAAVDADWNRWQRTLPVRTGAALLAELVTVADPAAEEDGIDRGALAALALPERTAQICGHLRTRLAATLETPVERVPEDVPLTALGVDSLMGIELKNRIEASFGVSVPAALVLQGPTVRELAEHVGGQLTVADSGRDDPDELLARLDELSEAELDRLLAEHATAEEGDRR